MTSRGPLTLAALASAAVPGLDPDSVVGVLPSRVGGPFEAAFVQDREHRRWVIRCPRTPAASAQLEQSAALLSLLARRLTIPVPAVKGWVALPEGGRAAVHSYLTGRMVELSEVAPGSALAAGLGRSLALLHNLDIEVYEEAGVPVYDAETYRNRRLAELDRAAATGRVPTGLLGRWERILDDASLWSFTSTPTHGRIGAGTVLATPDDGQEPDVKAFLGWESAQVADPADDLAPLLDELDPEALDTVLEAYAHTRVERPDRNLHQRAELVREMQLVRSMMAAVAADDDDGAEQCASRLRRLDDRLARQEEAAAAEQRAAHQRAAATMAIPAALVDSEAPSAPGGPVTSPDTGGSDETTDSDPATGADVGTDPEEAIDGDPADGVVQFEHPGRPTPTATAGTARSATGHAAPGPGSTTGSTTDSGAGETEDEDDVVDPGRVAPADPNGLNR